VGVVDAADATAATGAVSIDDGQNLLQRCVARGFGSPNRTGSIRCKQTGHVGISNDAEDASKFMGDEAMWT